MLRFHCRHFAILQASVGPLSCVSKPVVRTGNLLQPGDKLQGLTPAQSSVGREPPRTVSVTTLIKG